ncbi:hypothetical protein HS088_TW11G00516 [Tripterygium wilfordii]|uniref:Uncharacterized protein n=1 Tax=Tripterygium wilfordii TaxID=458696 RepID=A0A7J7D271_TRIWF|nr:hypothetical protein HS088_TW11G00516 [Tripterygium wilfordii]
MGRQPCCDKVGLKRGPWTIEEDHKLVNFILNNGIHCWRAVPKLAGLLRCGKSCRLRWINYLRPDLKRGNFTEAEENQIIQLHSRLGNRWSKIASHFPGRTDNEIKNHWNTRIKKKLNLLGLDPVTHKPVEQTENSTANYQTISVPEPNSSTTTKEQEDDAVKDEEEDDDHQKKNDQLDVEETIECVNRITFPIDLKLVIFGRRHVGIMSAEPVGNYGVRIIFDDLHKTGIYTWDYFYHLGSNKFSLMRNYIKTLKKHGLSRDPSRRN